MSRGTTRRIAFGRRTRTLPNSSRSVTTANPSGPPAKPPLRLRSTSAIAPGGGGSATRWTIADGVAGLGQELGQAGRLVGCEHDARALGLPVLDALDEPGRPPGRQHGLAPAEQVARRSRPSTRGHPLALARLRLPGQLERPRSVQPRLPVARRQVRGRPVPRAARRLDELRLALVRLAPQELGGVREVARLIEDEQRRAGRDGRGAVAGATSRPQTSAASPTASARLPSVAASARRAGSRDRLAPRTAPGRPPAARAAATPGRPSREPRPDVGRRRAGAGTPSPAAAPPREPALDAPLVGRVERPEGVHLVAEELDPDRQGSDVAGTRRRCPRAGRSRLGPRPPARACTRARTARAGARRARSASAGRRRPGSGRAGRPAPSVAWRSAWTLATRTRARPVRHAASAATRAAVSSGTSSLRSYASEVRGSSTATSDGSPEPRRQLLGHPVADLRVARDPADPLAVAASARAAARYDFAPCGTDVSPACRPWMPGAVGLAEPLAQGRERPRSRGAGAAGRRGPGRAARRRGTANRARDDPARAAPAVDASVPRASRSGGAAPGRRVEQLQLGVRRSPVEIDLLLARLGCRASLRPFASDLLGDVALARRPAPIAIAHRRAAFPLVPRSPPRIRRQPVLVRRTPDSSGGPPTSPGGRRVVALAGCLELERVEPVGGLRDVPHAPRPRPHRPPRRAGSAGASARRRAKRDSTWSIAPRPGSPIPTRSRPTFSRAQLLDDRAQPVVAAVRAALAEPELAERQREVVDHHQQVRQRRALAGQQLAHRDARVVHVGQAAWPA